MARQLIIADENIPGVRERFAPLGEVVRLPGRTLTAAQVADADALLVRSVTRVDRALLAGSRVSWVGTATIGTDHLDTDWLDSAGIAYASAPGSNADSVVDYVLSVLAAADDRLERLLAGASRAAVVGVGNVGARLLRRLQALNIDVIGCDPPLAEAGGTSALGAAVATLPLHDFEAVLRRDVILVHTPLTRGGSAPTLHLFDAAALRQLQDGALLVNAGRGAVVDNRALREALVQQRFNAVLDVWEHEPAIDPILRGRVLLGTPHIAGYSLDGKLAGARQLLDAYCGFLGRSTPPLSDATAPGPSIELDPSLADAELLRRAIFAVYDVREDHRRLESVACEEAVLAVGFDRLRKEYPVRRELSTATVGNWASLSAHQQQLLSALGLERALP